MKPDEKTSIEIMCPACGREALLIRAPVYDGLTKTGDTLQCSSCGHVFDREEDVPFKRREETVVFTDADRSPDVEIFEEDEKGRLCRYCRHYVVNPFTQWCGIRRKEVEATDTCEDFEALMNDDG